MRKPVCELAGEIPRRLLGKRRTQRYLTMTTELLEAQCVELSVVGKSFLC